MRRSAWRIAAFTAAGILALLLVTGFAFVFSGAYNVAATVSHTGLVRWALNETQHRSVAARADDLPPAPSLADDALLHGFDHFNEMCVVCHGAPGIDRGEFGQGITPTPPDLAEAADDWTARELFWITSNGIKLAGMPAFGPTHSEEEIWGIVAFLQRLGDMSPAEYQQWIDRADGGTDQGSGGHEHAPGTDDHAH